MSAGPTLDDLPFPLRNAIDAYLSAGLPLSLAARAGRVIAFTLRNLGPQDRAALKGYPWGRVIDDAMRRNETDVMRRAAQLVASRMTPEARQERARMAGVASGASRRARAAGDPP